DYWKHNGNYVSNPSSPNSLYNAFYTSARSGYKAGTPGTKPIPASVQIFDDFETSEGHFAGASFNNVGGTTGINTAGSFKVRQNDADSYTKIYSEKIGIADDTSVSTGWYWRCLSGNGTAANNTPITLTPGTDGSVGFYARLYTVNGSEDLSPAVGQLTVQDRKSVV